MNVALTGAVRHPKIYAWTDPDHAAVVWEGSRPGVGLVKVGGTDRDDVEVRIKESRGVMAPKAKPYEVLLVESAVTNDGHVFRDHAVHERLERAGVRRVPGPNGERTEWFECTVDELRNTINDIRSGSSTEVLHARAAFPMRPEQERAVAQTARYFSRREGEERPPHFLWNAKMRFGKTFTTYQLAKRLGWTRILVLTYKPAVEAGWREDLEGHVDFESWRFKGKSDPPPDLSDPSPLVWFASFQDVLGTDDTGNPKAKNLGLYDTTWDAVVIDEYHFGAWRDAARALYTRDADDADIVGDATEKDELDTPDLDEDFAANLEASLALDVRGYLYLSGTPFRALTQGEFLEDQVYNWTYSDEQHAKTTWTSDRGQNPYASLPKMYLLAYEMPDALRAVALNNRSEFSLTEFFRTNRDSGEPRFVHETEVQKWLDLLRGQDITGLWANVSNLNRPPLPYEDTNLLRALQHTVWYLPNVDACVAMRDLLAAPSNTFFRDYRVIVAAGKHVGMGARALEPVDAQIGPVPQDTKTITLSCAKLMTGVTVPAWAGILMLRELNSPESYFQAAFRVQSPWRSKLVDTTAGGDQEVVHKEHCFVIDFSPNRALRQIVDYATRLRSEAASERDDQKAVDEFMEFLPVLSFDGYGMSQLRAEDVLDYLTRGISSSMLARRWNSPELLTFDIRAMEALLDNPALLASLEQVEVFRNITDDLTALISANTELRQKALTKEKLTKEEQNRKDDASKKREDLKKRLQRFVTRIPAFMYLTDDRERTIKDIIMQLEPELFQKVTGLTLRDFEQLVDAGVFNDSKMNDAVWKFRMFEEPSLHYTETWDETRTLGGWSLTRDETFAKMVAYDILEPGMTLTGVTGVTAAVTGDFGISVGGVRLASPELAAEAAGADGVDGWQFWTASTLFGVGTLGELRSLLDEVSTVS